MRFLPKYLIQLRFTLMVMGALSIYAIYFKSLTMGVIWPSILFLTSPMIMDEKNKLDTLFCSLPLKREDSVKASYLIPICMSGFWAIGVIGIVKLFPSLTYAKVKYTLEWSHLYEGLLPFFIIMTLMVPVRYKIGFYIEFEQKKIVTAVVVIFLGLALIGAWIMYMVTLDSNEYMAESLSLLLFLAFLPLCYLSYRLSLRFYRKKEI